MSRNRHFATVATWAAARELVTFEPRTPRNTAGNSLQSLCVHIRDHKLRDLPPAQRSLEAHYGAFVIHQERKGADAARRQALDTPYGRDGRDESINGCAGRVYPLGPDPAADDIDGRSPAVVAWHDGEIFFLVASSELDADVLLGVARSLAH